MKFLIDENLSPALADLFNTEGLTAYHINQFKAEKKERIRDDQLRRLSLYHEYIIVTRDDDFVSSFVSRKVPEKMIFVFDLDSRPVLIERFRQVVPELPGLMQRYDFLEINPREIRMPFE